MLSFVHAIWLGLVLAALSLAQNTGDREFTAAYECLTQKNYDSAIEHFRAGLAKESGRAHIHEDLAYTLLKTGDSVAARDEFEAALHLDPKDEQAALEFGFLAYETGKQVEARRIFDHLRKTGSAATKKTAEQAYQNIDAPLAEGIAHSQEILAHSSPSTNRSLISAHCELLRLAELRDDLALAARENQSCGGAKTQSPELAAASPEAPGTGGWAKILDAVGLEFPSRLIRLADSGANILEDGITIVQGNSPLAEQLGIHAGVATFPVRQISDVHNSRMQITWRQPAVIPRTELPLDFQIFAREKSADAPVLAGKRTARGAILWIATSPGEKGFERYPYLIQSLVDLGLTLPARSVDLWAFFDSSYRIRSDVNYLAERWRQAGIAVLHVAGWHNMEPDPTNDEYLARLIEACHRHAILVYMWLELPHVSERFWADHAEWREKTPLHLDAQVDWRKPMNLQNPECSRAADKLIENLAARFDWDGVNLAELSFESPEGLSDPSRFTPMNDNVRGEFKEIAGFDAALLFDETSAHANDKDRRTFLDFRAALARRLQSEWLKNIGTIKKSKPYLDIVLTRTDGTLDAALQVQDPLAAAKKDFGLDIKVLERSPDVYPTRKPTGVEMLESVHDAARSFSHVAIYSESSVEAVDLPFVGAAAAVARVVRQEPDGMEFDSPGQTRFLWKGPVEVDGKLWAVRNGDQVLAPAGHHRMTAAVMEFPLAVTDFNGRIQSATVLKSEVDLAYESRTRALVTFDRNVGAIEIDGAPFWKAGENKNSLAAVLPAGQHLVTFTRR